MKKYFLPDRKINQIFIAFLIFFGKNFAQDIDTRVSKELINSVLQVSASNDNPEIGDVVNLTLKYIPFHDQKSGEYYLGFGLGYDIEQGNVELISGKEYYTKNLYENRKIEFTIQVKFLKAKVYDLAVSFGKNIRKFYTISVGGAMRESEEVKDLKNYLNDLNLYYENLMINKKIPSMPGYSGKSAGSVKGDHTFVYLSENEKDDIKKIQTFNKEVYKELYNEYLKIRKDIKNRFKKAIQKTKTK